MYCIYKYIYIYMYIYMERYDMTRCCTVRCCIHDRPRVILLDQVSKVAHIALACVFSFGLGGLTDKCRFPTSCCNTQRIFTGATFCIDC